MVSSYRRNPKIELTDALFQDNGDDRARVPQQYFCLAGESRREIPWRRIPLTFLRFPVRMGLAEAKRLATPQNNFRVEIEEKRRK